MLEKNQKEWERSEPHIFVFYILPGILPLISSNLYKSLYELGLWNMVLVFTVLDFL